MATIEVSYHRTVNLGSYNNAHLGGKIVEDNFDPDLVLGAYTTLQEQLKTEVDKIADRIMAEATLSKRS